MQVARKIRKFGLVVAAAAMVLVSGCSSFSDWDPFGKKAKPLPGERIAVLLNERSLSADASAAGTKVLLPAPDPNPDWPMAGGYANHAMYHIAVGENLKQAWSVDIGTGASKKVRFVGTPIVANKHVFAMDTKTRVSAYEADTGKRIWRVELEPDDDAGHVGGGIAFEQGRIFVATGFAVVIAVDAGNGKVLWKQKVDAPMRAAPTVRGGIVFALTIDNKLVALNAQDGSTLWTHNGAPESAALLGSASPAVDSGIVVVPYTSGEIFALKADTGKVLWQDNLVGIRRTDVVSSLAQIRGRPVIDRGRVIAISHAGVMAAIDLRTGRRLWQREIGGQESPWVAGDYIYTLTNDMEMICVNRDDGQVLWVTGLPRYKDDKKRDKPIIWTGPVLTSDRLIVAGSSGEALAISPYDGRILGQVEMPDGVSVPPIVAAGSVYFLANDAELVAYR